jgi:PAS domain-containing protein
MPMADTPGPDFEAVFASAPGNYLLLAPDFTIIGANDAYLAATSTARAGIVGRPPFEVFPWPRTPGWSSSS